MAITPKFYKQTDSRWATYSWRGVTIGRAGCAPTSIANVVAALVNPDITPKNVFKWLCNNGYMTLNSGTYWSGMTAGLKHYGIKKFTVTGSSAKAKESLKKGHWLISVVGPSRWTSGGHYIVVYKLKSNGTLSISDSASSSDYRQENGPFSEFARAEKQCWIDINPADYKKSEKPKKEDKKVVTYTMWVSDSYANVRKGRGTKYGVKGKLKRGTKLILKNYSKGWYQIASGTFKGYYISQNTLSKYQPINVTYKVLPSVGMNIRSGYTTKSDIVGKLTKGTKFKATKKKGNWVYSPALKGWVCVKSGDTTYLKKV